MPLGAWPKIALDAIRANFEETKLRVERGGDLAGQKKAVAQKIQIEQAQLEQQQDWPNSSASRPSSSCENIETILTESE